MYPGLPGSPSLDIQTPSPQATVINFSFSSRNILHYLSKQLTILYSWRHTTHTSTPAFTHISVEFLGELIPLHGHRAFLHCANTQQVCVVNPRLMDMSGGSQFCAWTKQHFKANFRKVVHGGRKDTVLSNKVKINLLANIFSQKLNRTQAKGAHPHSESSHHVKMYIITQLSPCFLL